MALFGRKQRNVNHVCVFYKTKAKTVVNWVIPKQNCVETSNL